MKEDHSSFTGIFSAASKMLLIAFLLVLSVSAAYVDAGQVICSGLQAEADIDKLAMQREGILAIRDLPTEVANCVSLKPIIVNQAESCLVQNEMGCCPYHEKCPYQVVKEYWVQIKNETGSVIGVCCYPHQEAVCSCKDCTIGCNVKCPGSCNKRYGKCVCINPHVCHFFKPNQPPNEGILYCPAVSCECGCR